MGDDADGLRLTGMGLLRRRPHHRQHPAARGRRPACSTASARSIRSRASAPSAISSTSQWWHKDDDGDVTKANLYYVYYTLQHLHQQDRHDFEDPRANGVSDEFEQYEHRNVYGGNLSQSLHVAPVRRQRAQHGRRANAVTTTFRRIGTSTSSLAILYVRWTRSAFRKSTSASITSNEIKWGTKVRTVLGLREDYFHWDVDDFVLPENSGHTES